MTVNWTPEQILALAPDASSAKSGKGLAILRKWSTLGQHEQTIWGECQGSAATPYRTQIDLSEPAFRCSCPSRKFPCKHALALFLLLSGQPAAFPTTAPPDWVTEWRATRAARAEKSAKKASNGVADTAAQVQRVAKRQTKVSAGLDELELWLGDLIRHGLATAEGRPKNFWEGMAARLVDAQAPGLARLLRNLSWLPGTGSNWPDRLLERLARLHLLLEAAQRLDTLPPEIQADVRTFLGWSQRQEELLAETGVQDRWLVAGRVVEEEYTNSTLVLRTQRSWLVGERTGRTALILHFAHTNQPLDVSLVPGTTLEAEIVFYPSAVPQRGVIKSRQGVQTNAPPPPAHPTFEAAFGAYADTLARLPWIEQFPLSLSNVVPTRYDTGWSLQDADNRLIPLGLRCDAWQLFALSGGHPLQAFGEWNGQQFFLLSVWSEGRFIPL
jgi:hypothetical protein